MSSYLPRVEEIQLPTPPASISSDANGDSQGDAMQGVQRADGVDLPTPVSDPEAPPRTMFRFSSPKPNGTPQEIPSYRRRFGRNARLHVEECRPQRTTLAEHSGVVYDSDDDCEEETIVYPVDYYGSWTLNYRSSLLSSRSRVDPAADNAARRSSSSIGNPDVAMVNGQATAGHPQPKAVAATAGGG